MLGFGYMGVAIMLLVPMGVDLVERNPDWVSFALSSLVVGGFGLLLSTATGGYKLQQMSARHAFLITALSWLTLPLAGSLPFLGLGVGIIDAFFESVSGFTTTGSTILVGLDSMPPGLLVWRSMTQWIGGVGIIGMAILMLPQLRVGGMQLFRTESSEKGEKAFSRATQLGRWIIGVYSVLTVLCAIAFWISGMSWFDAINHAMTTLSSGGFSTHDASFDYFQNQSTIWVGIIFMIFSGLPFVLLIEGARGNVSALFRDPQVRVFLGLLLVCSIGIAFYLGHNNEYTIGTAFAESAFVVTSIVTTTGFGLGDYTAWGAPMVGIIFVLTFCGACTGSTTGGIKTFRFIVFFASVSAHLKRMIRPDRVVSLHYGDSKITPDLGFSVLAFLVAYLAVTGLVTVILTSMGLDLVTAVSSAATALGNVGPGLGDQVGPVGTFAEIPEAAKLVLAFSMLLGRLEIFTVLILLEPEFWS
ncbi:TrkH family potassium uptake protein [Rhodobacteraceae bacterium RKSG542]|nr:TrkH family potassium uptake protein [Pseudovibrio flavus]